MPRISHKKATTLSCVLLDENRIARTSEAVAETLDRDLRSNSSNSELRITSTCTVAAAVKRLLPLVTCPLQPHVLLQRCACLHLPAALDAHGEYNVCVSTTAAACTIMWSLMLEDVGDVVQRGILKIFSESRHVNAVEVAGSLVLLGAEAEQEQHGEDDGVASSFAGVPASIDMLLCDDIGRRLLTCHMEHVMKLLYAAAAGVLYSRGSAHVNQDISSSGDGVVMIIMMIIKSPTRSQVTTSFCPPFEASFLCSNTKLNLSIPSARSPPSALSAPPLCLLTTSSNSPRTLTKPPPTSS